MSGQGLFCYSGKAKIEPYTPGQFRVVQEVGSSWWFIRHVEFPPPAGSVSEFSWLLWKFYEGNEFTAPAGKSLLVWTKRGGETEVPRLEVHRDMDAGSGIPDWLDARGYAHLKILTEDFTFSTLTYEQMLALSGFERTTYDFFARGDTVGATPPYEMDEVKGYGDSMLVQYDPSLAESHTVYGFAVWGAIGAGLESGYLEIVDYYGATSNWNKMHALVF